MDRGWGMREPCTMTLLLFYKLNQEKKFFRVDVERLLEALPGIIKDLG